MNIKKERFRLKNVPKIYKMDLKYRMLLQNNQKDIVKDLDVIYIIDELLSKEAVTTEAFDHIFTLTNRAERTRYLIDTLIQNGTNQSFDAFVDSLSKDHRWLWEKMTIQDMKTTMLNDSFEDILSRGDVPRLPDHYVSRAKLIEEVHSKLQLLTRHKVLVLHGMSGSGKTSVAIGVLREKTEMITDNFNGVVFWLNLGNVKTEDDIVMQQSKLQRKLSSMYNHRDSSYMNSSISMSSIGSNADSQSLTSYDFSWQDMRDTLKSVFSEQGLKEALLVLDDVNEKKAVQAFDIGCKLLITTRDTEVVSNLNPTIIKVVNNLEEQESMQLFASCLEISVAELPKQAKKLNEVCKGSPFHIALIGAQLAENKERLIHDHRHWYYYITKLAKKELFSLRPSDNPMKTVEVCINSLNPVILPLFKMLVILPDNVKIKAKVLSKLWSKQESEVETIMKQLRSKSLIIETYDHDQRNYLYEVHDLIMNYLRVVFKDKKDETQRMHVNFLKSYGFNGSGNTPDLTDDGYIPYYIAYHVFHTDDLYESWRWFQMYLDLNFIGRKVRLTGPADAIMDIQKYEMHIAKNEPERELLLHIKSFLSTYGHDLFRYPYTDIVQSILQYESKGILYGTAYKIAQENSLKNELYFEFLHEQNAEEIKYSTIDVKEVITTVCFLADYVLVGTVSGVIKVFHINTSKLKKELPCTNLPIKWVSACPCNVLVVAAVTCDGVVNIWYMDDLDLDSSDGTIEEEPDEIPYNVSDDAPVTINPILGALLNCHWLNTEEILITHTSKIIILYNTDGKVNKVIDNFDRDRLIIDCVPTNDDYNVIVASKNSNLHFIEVFNIRSKEKIISFEETMEIFNILCVPGTNRLLVMNETDIMDYEFGSQSPYHQNLFNSYKSQKIISSNDVKDYLKFISAVVNKGGTLLFVSTNDSRVICVDLKTNTYIFDLDNRRGDVVSMAVSEVCYEEFVPGIDVLLTGTGSMENSVKVWYLETAYVTEATQKHQKARKTTIFDVSFLQSPSTPGQSPQHDNSPPRRHQSFDSHKRVEKRSAKKTMSLDRHALKPLNLKGICNGNEEGVIQPLLAVVDDKNNIQIIRGTKVLTVIQVRTDDKIRALKISPCNQYIIYGLQSGSVMKYFLRSKEAEVIMDIYSSVQYMNFVTPSLLVVAGKNKCLMAYNFSFDSNWQLQMLQKGNMHLGSQEILNGLQGNSKKNGLSPSDSDASITSKDRFFPSETKSRLCKGSYLVDCFWVAGVGMITVEDNATVKLWGQDLKLVGVLNGRQTDVHINCAAFQKHILALCDDYGKFQVFDLKENDEITLQTIQENKVNFKILSCDLTADGNILAMGLDSGDVVLWNIPLKMQMYFLRHHKSRVQCCFFSPVPDRLHRSNSIHSPMVPTNVDDNQPCLTLVTMATEIVWWNVSYIIKMRAPTKMFKGRRNVLTPSLTPLNSPMLESRSDLTAALNNLNIEKSNFFFSEGSNIQEGWECYWKNKKYKEGSKKKEMLACIKLSGMNAKNLCHDDKFSCFVTVDNPGHVHIMNIMKPTS